jgi:hypothetical protein
MASEVFSCEISKINDTFFTLMPETAKIKVPQLASSLDESDEIEDQT